MGIYFPMINGHIRISQNPPTNDKLKEVIMCDVIKGNEFRITRAKEECMYPS